MKSVEEIIDAVGRKNIRDQFGVTNQLIWHHAKAGSLPGNWYDGMCRMAGQDLPRELFTWKPLAAKTSDLSTQSEKAVES